MKLHVLGSSSSGNCYLFQSEKTGEVLAVEAGVKFNKVKKVLDFNLNSIVGCIVSHEHGDHAKCVGDFINACIPCYMSQGTKHALGFSSSYWAKGLLPFEQVVINGFRVIPFPVQHDAAEPYGYLIRHEELLKRAVSIVEENIDNFEFSTDEFAQKMNMSRSNLHLKLKAITGESAIDFIRKVRFKRATELLKSGRYTVTEVSSMVGFNSSSYFATCFKKYIGCLPTEYIKKVKG